MRRAAFEEVSGLRFEMDAQVMGAVSNILVTAFLIGFDVGISPPMRQVLPVPFSP